MQSWFWYLQEEANPARNAADVLIEEIDDRAPQVQPVHRISYAASWLGGIHMSAVTNAQVHLLFCQAWVIPCFSYTKHSFITVCCLLVMGSTHLLAARSASDSGLSMGPIMLKHVGHRQRVVVLEASPVQQLDMLCWIAHGSR